MKWAVIRVSLAHSQRHKANPLTPATSEVKSPVWKYVNSDRTAPFINFPICVCNAYCRINWDRWQRSSRFIRERCKCCEQRRTPSSRWSLWRRKRCARRSPMRTSRWRRRWRGTKPTKRQRTVVSSSKLLRCAARRPLLTCSWLSWRDAWPKLSAMWERSRHEWI